MNFSKPTTISLILLPTAFLRNQVVSGGLTSNLNVLSWNATTVTLIGTSGRMCVVYALKSLQNCIMLIPRGPNACPIFGDGLATPANTLSWMRALYSFGTFINDYLI